MEGMSLEGVKLFRFALYNMFPFKFIIFFLFSDVSGAPTDSGSISGVLKQMFALR
jgi:hypothetical protein